MNNNQQTKRLTQYKISQTTVEVYETYQLGRMYRMQMPGYLPRYSFDQITESDIRDYEATAEQ